LNCTVTNVGLVAIVNAQAFVVLATGQVGQPPKVDPLLGVAVRVIAVPRVNSCVLHGPGLEQLKPVGVVLTTVPDPLPRKLTTSTGLPLPPPDPVKQITLPVM
jgi:hypothetical protein